MRYIIILLFATAASNCSNRDSSTGEGKDSTVANITIDSSAVINDSTRLPEDSTNMGVTH